MHRARLVWRWCHGHPKTSGIGAAILALLVIAGIVGNPGQPAGLTAAGTSPTSTSTQPYRSQPARMAHTPTPTSAALTPTPNKITAVPADLAQQSNTTALAILATIPIKGRAPKTGYTRAQFGPAWTDNNNDPLGHNGCDTRNDVLRRDLTNVVLKPNSNSCAVLTGDLRDPYTATTIHFTRGASTSTAVQIDHVVSLSNAWQTGASRWTTQTRTDLANDPLNLLAVDGPTNEAKGDGDAATWLPPNKAYRCSYVARQIAVKVRYQLWTTQAEHDAMARVLSNCPTLAAPTELGTATIHLAPQHAAPPTTQRPTPQPIPTSADNVYYPNCDAARAAGAAPIYRGQPGYSARLDRDGDGVACE
jgi:hypothetical protein